MKLTIQAACVNNATLTVAGNVITNGSKDFVFDFEKGEHFYFAVGNGDGVFKGQTTTEAALEHLRDSFSFGDITAEAEGMYQQLNYLHKEFNGIYPHLKADEHCGTSLCDIMRLSLVWMSGQWRINLKMAMLSLSAPRVLWIFLTKRPLRVL